MTRSPLTATLIPLIPLAALGWPLSKVLNREAYQQIEPTPVEVGPLISADLEVQSAHPFEKIEVKAGKTTWTFGPDDDLQEILIPREDQIILTTSVTWPAGTPETAVLLTLTPDRRLDRQHTLWGHGEVTEEVTFTWDPEP